MRQLANLIDQFNEKTGKILAWLTLLTVLTQFFVVLGRYVFGIGSLMMQEAIIYMHATLFMLASAYVLKVDGHVRVDIFYREAAPRTKALVNLFGSIVFLLPMCVVIFWVSYPYVENSWAIMEGSRETSGIPGVFLLKTAILIFAVQMGLQGLSIILHSILAIRGDEDELNALRISD
jgi:TRAP-type mannitol/chloroaromatic compound transport system permease small subunit